MSLLSRRELLKLLALAPSWAMGEIFPKTAHAFSKKITFWVNEEKVGLNPCPNMTLLDFLRHDLGLKGPKYGCGSGVCGSCTVLINDRPVRACQVNPAHLMGLSVTTVEGLAKTQELHPVQKTFSDLGVFQCGYCAPGFVLTTKALLNKFPNPTEDQVRKAFYGNLCRCTGYQGIIQAVRAVNDFEYKKYLIKKSFISLSNPEPLAKAKVKGSLVYAQDISHSGELWAKLLLSPKPHIRIKKIDITEALALPKVVRVFLHNDIPGEKKFGSVVLDQPVLVKDIARFRGDVLAMVVALDRKTAELALQKIKVTYKALPGLFDPQEALLPNAIQLTDKGNLCHEAFSQKGDIEQGRKKAKVIVKGNYKTPMVDPAFLEPEACLSYVDEKGELVVCTASQAPVSYRDQIANICALPKEKVRLKTLPAGGAFGARGDMTIQHLCALATRITARPVRILLTREESFSMHVKRHSFDLEYELGADEKGRLTHCRVRGIIDAGAYHSATLPVVENAVAFATGPYEIPATDVKLKAAFTNNPTCGAMRGFGSPQVCLAMERQMDRLAKKLNLDPLEFRLRNALDKGRVSQWGQVMGDGVGIKACLNALSEKARNLAKDVKLRSNEVYGLGFACGYKNTSTPTNLPFGSTSVYFKLAHNGLIHLYTNGCEIGQGLVDSLAEIAGNALGISKKLIKVIPGDTTYCSSLMLTSGSQQVFLAGGAVLEAANKFSALLLKQGSKLTKEKQEDLALSYNGLFSKQKKKIILSYEQLALKSSLAGEKLALLYEYKPEIENIFPPKKVTEISPKQTILPSLGYAAQACAIAYDKKKHSLRLLGIMAAQDVGKAINYKGIEGQVQGAVSMALGWALTEDLGLDHGKVKNDNFDKYFILRSTDLPEIQTLIIEIPDPLGPYGAKGIGEVPVLPLAPALMNAISNAIGVELYSLPITKAQIIDGLKGLKS